jgi:hypothetical protein
MQVHFESPGALQSESLNLDLDLLINPICSFFVCQYVI